ncbi:MAG: hypothetical protein ACUVXJ_16845 [Phycisphaerae bacterium]
MSDSALITVPPVQDEGLRCLMCGDNLTGLSGSICPECGEIVVWEAVRRRRDEVRRRIGTPWERWRWRLKPVAFAVTCLQAAFLPWRFARQMRDRPSILSAAAFLLVCMGVPVLWVGVRRTGSGDSDILAWWMCGVICQVVFQTVVFGLLLPVDGVRGSLRFWFAVTAYTSYPLLPEIWTAPPYILAHESNLYPLDLLLRDSRSADFWASLLFYVWWIGLVVVALIRLPRRRWWRIAIMIVAIPLMTWGSTYFGCHMAQGLDAAGKALGVW